MADAIGALFVRDLKVSSNRGRILLSAPKLDIAAGAAVGIKGPSGAGKSTLLFALAGLQQNCTGAIKWGSVDLTAANQTAKAKFRRDHLGIVFQDFLLFDELGPLENGAIQSLFRPKTARAGLRTAASATLKQLGVSRDTGDVTTYSGGERQRISVARALAHDPAILLADEPTANLDRDAADALATDLVSQAKGKGRTLIVVSHDQSVLDQMDRVITVKDGVVA
ncbi:ABC transporter ATP-binding protein [Cognatishimia maritima]|uniref:Putative ABC transport system ATP-binding protein n=1 Tax=Cognatishimia maritima TaxID=870908 RepID=A0A1M5P341_9RHOB|nr:ABC transporter ATP-binding protein [Cognatishimia maritima]SHG96137.1 putative ABC transport system ATP-binding protein [Cognatishimia maritima]